MAGFWPYQASGLPRLLPFDWLGCRLPWSFLPACLQPSAVPLGPGFFWPRLHLFPLGAPGVLQSSPGALVPSSCLLELAVPACLPASGPRQSWVFLWGPQCLLGPSFLLLQSSWPVPSAPASGRDRSCLRSRLGHPVHPPALDAPLACFPSCGTPDQASSWVASLLCPPGQLFGTFFLPFLALQPASPGLPACLKQGGGEESSQAPASSLSRSTGRGPHVGTASISGPLAPRSEVLPVSICTADPSHHSQTTHMRPASQAAVFCSYGVVNASLFSLASGFHSLHRFVNLLR